MRGDDLFPSGLWTGFYNYQPGERHRMDLYLTFAQERMSGDGNDDIGRFTIRGRYEVASRECYWTKSYVGAHDVFYRGFREGKGIWGTWEITAFDHGGFHIWPKRAGEDETETNVASEAEPADAVTPEPAAACDQSNTKLGGKRILPERRGARATSQQRHRPSPWGQPTTVTNQVHPPSESAW